MPSLALTPGAATPIVAPIPSPAAPTIGGLTLAQARAEIIAMLKGRTDIPPERINFWLNRAYIDLATSVKHDVFKYSLSFSTVANQALYLLPALTVTSMLLTYSTAVGIARLRKIDLGAFRGLPDLSDSPHSYFRHNRLLVLHPTPDKVYNLTLDFRFIPEPLVSDNQSVLLRPDLHEAWLMLGHKKLLSALAEWEASTVVGNELVTHLRSRQDDEANEDEYRVPMSSRPRTARQLYRNR